MMSQHQQPVRREKDLRDPSSLMDQDMAQLRGQVRREIAGQLPPSQMNRLQRSQVRPDQRHRDQLQLHHQVRPDQRHRDQLQPRLWNARSPQPRRWTARSSHSPAQSLTAGVAERPPVAVLLRSPRSRQARVRPLRVPHIPRLQKQQDKWRQPRPQRTHPREDAPPRQQHMAQQQRHMAQVFPPAQVRSRSRERARSPPGFPRRGSTQPGPGILKAPRREQTRLHEDHAVLERDEVPTLTEANTTALLTARLLALERQAIQLGLPPPSVDVVMEAPLYGPPRSRSAPPAAIHSSKTQPRGLHGPVKPATSPSRDKSRLHDGHATRGHGVPTKIPAPKLGLGKSRRHSFCALPPPRSPTSGPPTPPPRPSLRSPRPVPAPRTLPSQGCVKPPDPTTLAVCASGPQLLKYLHTLVDLSPSWSTHSRTQLALLMDVLMDDPGAKADLQPDRSKVPASEQLASTKATPQHTSNSDGVPSATDTSRVNHIGDNVAPDKEPVHARRDQSAPHQPGLLDLSIVFNDTGDPSHQRGGFADVTLGKTSHNHDGTNTGDTFAFRSKDHVPGNHSVRINTGLCDLSIQLMKTGVPLRSSSPCSAPAGKPTHHVNTGGSHTGDPHKVPVLEDAGQKPVSVLEDAGQKPVSVLEDAGQKPDSVLEDAELELNHNSLVDYLGVSHDSIPTGDLTWIFPRKSLTGHHTVKAQAEKHAVKAHAEKLDDATKPPDDRSSNYANRRSNFADVTDHKHGDHHYDVAPPPSPEDSAPTLDKARHHSICVDDLHTLCWERPHIVRRSSCKTKEFKPSPREPGVCDNTCASGLLHHFHGEVPRAPSRLNPLAPSFVPASSAATADRLHNNPNKDENDASCDLTNWRSNKPPNKQEYQQGSVLLTSKQGHHSPYNANLPRPRSSCRDSTSRAATQRSFCISGSTSSRSDTVRRSSHEGSSPFTRRSARFASTSHRRCDTGTDTECSNPVNSTNFSRTHGYRPSSSPLTSGSDQLHSDSSTAPPVRRTLTPHPGNGDVPSSNIQRTIPRNSSAFRHRSSSGTFIAEKDPAGLTSLGTDGHSPQFSALFETFLASFAPPPDTDGLRIPLRGKSEAIPAVGTDKPRLKQSVDRCHTKQLNPVDHAKVASSYTTSQGSSDALFTPRISI